MLRRATDSRAWRFAVSVARTFRADQGHYRAALIAHYMFLSVFPLLLVAVSVLEFTVRGDPALRQDLLDQLVRTFPVAGQVVRGLTFERAEGSALVVAVGLAIALWSGLAVVRVVQTVSNDLWGVPTASRGGPVRASLRGLAVLGFFGVGLVAVTVFTGLVTAAAPTVLSLVVGFAASVALNVALVGLSFTVLTDRPTTWPEILPGAVVAAVGLSLLQVAGTALVTRKAASAGAIYGVFATVIGLLFWLQIGAELFIVCLEINVVRAGRRAMQQGG